MEHFIKTGLSIFFILCLFVAFIIDKSYLQILHMADYLLEPEQYGSDQVDGIDEIDSDFTIRLVHKDDFVEFNGAMMKMLHMRGQYSDLGIYITDDLYIVSVYPQTSTDYEYEQMMDFKQFLDENGINLLYVNEPVKYLDDNMIVKEFGVETYGNRNADKFLERIRAEGVPVIDLRDNVKEDGLDITDLFYRTDHHWTTRAGLWATRIIAEGLNTYCGYDIDLSLYDEDQYTFRDWKKCWLGEQGKKVAKAYVGLDDFTEIKPDFSTEYIFESSKGIYEGTFDEFVNENVYDDKNDNATDLWHYSYRKIDCINQKADYGKVLLLSDSYDHVTEPFLSLGVHEIDDLEVRGLDPSFDLRQYILDNDYDTVIIAYAQFMIGAHDDPKSANYRMFDFH